MAVLTLYNGLQPNSQYPRRLPINSSGAGGEQVVLQWEGSEEAGL